MKPSGKSIDDEIWSYLEDNCPDLTLIRTDLESPGITRIWIKDSITDQASFGVEHGPNGEVSVIPYPSFWRKDICEDIARILQKHLSLIRY